MSGRIELAYGPMFGYKTEWLIAELDGWKRGGYTVATFKPKIDRRYSPNEISSHSGQRFPATLVTRADEILEHVVKNTSTQAVGVEEVQFLDDRIIDVADELRNRDITVLMNGLLTTFANKLFPLGLGKGKLNMADLLSIVDDARRCYAICTYQKSNGATCGRRDATRTQRLFLDGTPVPYDDPLIVVGSDKKHKHMKHPRKYEARCSQHHFFSYNGKVLTLQELRKRLAFC